MVNLGVLGSSDRNSTGKWLNSAKLVKKKKKKKKIPVDFHRVGLEGHGDHQLIFVLKISKNSVKMVKRIVEDPHLFELWDLRDH